MLGLDLFALIIFFSCLSDMESVQITLTKKELEEVNKCLLYFNDRQEKITAKRNLNSIQREAKRLSNCTNSEVPQNMDNKNMEKSLLKASPLPVKLEKSREEIMAEREAKKLQKQASKQRKKSENNSNVEKKDVQEKIPDKQQIKSEEHKTKPELCKEPKIETPKQTDTGKGDASKVVEEKSREAIKAERELKKLAKQAAKNKKDIKTVSAPITPSSNVQSAQPTIPASKGQETSVPEKSKAELKAERRAKQEAQRQAKEEKKVVAAKENKPAQDPPAKIQQPPPATVQKESLTTPKKQVTLGHQQRVKLFSHLHFDQISSPALITSVLHPAVVELGAKYSSRIVSGSNARCVALLQALKRVIVDYSTPAEKEFSRGLETCLGDSMTYLNQCRPSSVSMTNALKHIKCHLTQLPNEIEDDDAKKKLCDVIDTFIREQIDVASDAICIAVQKKIANGDVILIYACSSLLFRILEESHREGKEFRVVVVDGSPWFEGREMLRRLVSIGIKCDYVLVSALAFIMSQTTKVLIGAHALLANGYVMSRAGSSLVALMAKAYNVPVLVCCETYKFCERVQTDVFVYNELGNPEDFVMTDKRLKAWESTPHLTPLSLLYDITPPDLVTAVVTEIAILPCTSVPVILRIKPSDMIV